jgi:hypothetical protein
MEIDLRHLDAVEVAAVRQQITNLIGHRAVEMVNVTIEHIKNGNYQAMKYLFEMAGLFPAGTAEETPGADSLAKTILGCLGIEEASSGYQAAKRDAGGKVEADAVK